MLPPRRATSAGLAATRATGQLGRCCRAGKTTLLRHVLTNSDLKVRRGGFGCRAGRLPRPLALPPAARWSAAAATQHPPRRNRPKHRPGHPRRWAASSTMWPQSTSMPSCSAAREGPRRAAPPPPLTWPIRLSWPMAAPAAGGWAWRLWLRAQCRDTGGGHMDPHACLPRRRALVRPAPNLRRRVPTATLSPACLLAPSARPPAASRTSCLGRLKTCWRWPTSAACPTTGALRLAAAGWSGRGWAGASAAARCRAGPWPPRLAHHPRTCLPVV